MTRRTRRCALSALLLAITAVLPSSARAADLELERGDHVVYIGNTMADRMQHHAWLETYIHTLHPKHQLTFRNLGFSGDEVTTRQRSANFGSSDQWLTKTEADVVFCFFGYNEALRGEGQLSGFRKNLARMIDSMRGQKYNGESAPRLVIFSPIAHENLRSSHLPDGSANNEKLALYTAAMADVCREKNARFVDLFNPTLSLYSEVSKPLTVNGIHLLEHGNQAVAKIIAHDLFGQAGERVTRSDGSLTRLREAVLEKNYYWFSRYRVVDGYNVYGGRSRLSWFGMSNADVMRREMEIFDIMTANRDVAVWAAAQGREHKVVDNNLPPELEVRTNKPGQLENDSHPYLGGKEAIGKMKIAQGMEVNLFASEEMFPEIVNPVQMAVDTNGRLFASVWPSYPHWNPTEPRTDRIVCLPDDDGDGVADKCITFADELNSITAFEFWGGGMLVAAPPEIWFLQDTDGDYVADKKTRMLQGVSSADTHHSANAMLIGPDGWLYWSRGIFNVAAMETPTRTYRSGATGVHRFNPRTFEIEFHFPIGPNPHGDVFDQWGYQFANDGTGGTGSYVNIGKGRGNRKWFQKRMRPVAATGLLSSSHFPEKNQGNFLICNTIGFRGVLQHEVSYDGADIRATEVEPIVYSDDPNFRPTDVEIGGDGALYVSDWCNVLIGHMQHNMRDPNRDHTHGRIYRFTAKGRPLLKPHRLKGKPIPEVLQAFYAKETPSRYRARLELGGRDTKAVLTALASWTAKRNAKNADDAQALLECLWVHEEHRKPNLALVKKVFQADEPRVRAAAIRSLGHWGPRAFLTPGAITDGWQDILMHASRDESPLVRAEALKAAVEYTGTASAEVIFEVATRPMGSELENVLAYARQNIDVDAMVADAMKSGRELSRAAQAYALQKASANLLVSMARSDAVYEALLTRAGIPAKYRMEAVVAFAKKNRRTPVKELIFHIADAEKNGRASLDDLTQILLSAEPVELAEAKRTIAGLASGTSSAPVRTAAYAAWIRSGAAKAAWKHALRSRESLTDFLAGLSYVDSVEAREPLFALIRPLTKQLPEHLRSDEDGGSAVASGPAVAWEYWEPHPAQNVALETLDRVKPKLTGRHENFKLFIPGGRRDAFATRQIASIRVPKSGGYTFYTSSDDGSRLYIDKKLVVNNDGLHGTAEAKGRIRLEAGLHEIIVTFFENGGSDALKVEWRGPGVRRQEILTSALRPAGSANLRAVAIGVIARWPGHVDEKVEDLAALAASDSLSGVALNGLATVPSQHVLERLEDSEAQAVLGALVGLASEASPADMQSDEYLSLLGLGDALLAKAGTLRVTAGSKLKELRASIPVKADPKVMALGKEVYSRDSHCTTCHQPHGQGLPNLYPPLDGSLWATGSVDRMIRIVLDGMHGTVVVKGKTYRSPPIPPMTGFRQLLNDKEIAAVLTYVRNSWSNRAMPVEPSEVARARAEKREGGETFWSAADIVARYPLEDGTVIEDTGSADGWVPRLVKEWKTGDIKPSDVTAGKRSFDIGLRTFTRLGCSSCHKMAGSEGGVFGPDLAALDPKTKKNAEFILGSLLDPSKDVEEAYSSYSFVLNTGEVFTGLLAKEENGDIHVVSDPLAPARVVKKNTILAQQKQASSIMPEGILNTMTKEEILDLIAYVLAGGKKDAAIFGN